MQRTVFTVGHSTQTENRFLDLLRQHGVTAICDVRSTPYSRVNPQFNREDLKRALRSAGIAYVFLGKELGARSDDETCYKDGKVQYSRIARTRLFESGLERVLNGSVTHRISLMCAEKEPLDCHRTILVARHLIEAGVEVQHIHGNGQLETQAEALRRLMRQLGMKGGDMFRSESDLFAEAYERQEDRIAYTKSKPDENVDLARPAVL